MSEDTSENERIPDHSSPFVGMKIEENDFLDDIEGRRICEKCNRSRKFFCYSCYCPVGELIGKLPKVKLPVKIDIIKHKQEIDGKSTAIHACVLAPDDVKIYTYPDIPDYTKEEGVVLIFPSATSTSVASLFNEDGKFELKENFGLPRGINMGTLLRYKLDDVVITEDQHKLVNKENFIHYDFDNLPIKRAVFIDSTWHQCKSIYKDERLRALKSVVIQNRISHFWRHQKKSPRWYLATIEAIHQFLLEVHIAAWGLKREYKGLEDIYVNLDHIPETSINDGINAYAGQYDNLLFFFTYMYRLIHTFYDHNDLRAYRRPMF